MKICSKCYNRLDDNAQYCNVCGSRIELRDNRTQFTQNYYQQDYGMNPCNSNYTQQEYSQIQYNSNYYQQYYNPFDYTKQFDEKDIIDNKVFAMLIYLTGILGIIIALLTGGKSPFLLFHIKEGMKFIVVNTVMSIFSILFCWTLLVPLVSIVLGIVLFIVRLICFFRVCQGKSVKPALIRNMNFLN